MLEKQLRGNTSIKVLSEEEPRGGQGGWQGKLLEKKLRGNTSIKVLSEEEQEGVRVAGRVSC